MDEERLYHILQGAALFSDGCRKAFNAHRTSIKLFHDGQQQPPVQCVQSETVHLKKIQGLIRHGAANHAIRLDLGKIANPTQKPVCNTRCPAAALRDGFDAVGLTSEAQNPRGPLNNHGQFITWIELQTLHNTETVTQG